MQCNMMAANGRRCQHKVKQFDTQCSFLPNIVEVDALCVIGLAIRLHMCWRSKPDVVVQE
jgi:hypothetical protein